MEKPSLSVFYPLVVCSLLFSACGGRYDVGEEPNAENGGVGGGAATGAGGSGDTGSGGASVSGGTGGASTAGGTGGTDGGSGGASAAAPGMGGASMTGGVGGSDAVGGAGGGMMPAENFVCGVPAFDLGYGQFADESTIRDRLTRFFFDEGADPSSPALDGDPPEAAADLVRAWLADARSTGKVPAGLAAFMRGFMLDRIEGAEDDLEPHHVRLGELWGGVLAGEGTALASLFAPEDAPPEPFGIFTDAAQLWSEPSARGAWMADKLFCMPVTPEPPGGDPTPPPPAGTTRRDWVSGMVTQPVCAGCHSIIDPLGFSMEILAPETGEYRTTDNGLPIDASGLFTTDSGQSFMFTDIGMLSGLLSTSCDVARCFVTLLFDRAVSVSAIDGYEPSDVDWVLYQFAKDDSFTLEDALVSLVQTPAFLH